MANLLIDFWKVRANYAYTMWKINAQESTVQKLSTTSSAKAKTWAQWVCQNKNYIFRLIFKFTSVLKCMQNCWPKKVHKKTGLGHFFRPSFFLNLFQKLFVTEVNLHLGNQTKINTFRHNWKKLLRVVETFFNLLLLLWVFRHLSLNICRYLNN